MSYSPPSGNALIFGEQPAYSPPAGNALVFGSIVCLADPVNIGISFGTPLSVSNRTETATSAIIPINFGNPVAAYTRFFDAGETVLPIAFGEPDAIFGYLCDAESVDIPLSFGTPVARPVISCSASSVSIPLAISSPVGRPVNYCNASSVAPVGIAIGNPSALVDFLCNAYPVVVNVSVSVPATFYQPAHEVTVYPDVTPDPEADGTISAPGGNAPYPNTPTPSKAVQSLVWRAVVTLGGVDVSDLLTGGISINAREDSARVADFSLSVPAGYQITIPAWFGQSVTIDFIRSVGGVDDAPVRLFTGRVGQPTYDIMARVASFACTDDLQNYCRNNDVTGLIGGLSSPMIEQPTDGWEKAQQLLETRNASLQLDASGLPFVTDWNPAADIDWLFDANVILDETPTIDIPDWLSQVNKVELEFSHRFTRLYSQVGRTDWFTPPFTIMMLGHGLDNFNKFGPDSVVPFKFPPKKSVYEAFQGSGLVLDQSVITAPPAIVTQYPAIEIDDSALGYPGIVYAEMPRDYVSAIAPDGDVIYYVSSKRSFELCQGFVAYWSRSWTQQAEEVFKVSVKNQSSIDQFGEVTSSQTLRLTTEFDATAWEADAARGLVASGINNAGVNMLDVEAAYQVAIAKARKTIFESHRRSSVGFSTSLIPSAAVGQRVKIETEHVKTTGQVRSISIGMDIESGKATTQWECAVMTLNGSLYEHTDDVQTTLPGTATPSTPNTQVVFDWDYRIINAPPDGWEDDPGYVPDYVKNEAVLSVEGVPDVNRDFSQYETTVDLNVGWVEDIFEVTA